MINETSTAFIRDLIEKLSTHQYKESFGECEEYYKSLSTKQLHDDVERLEDSTLMSIVKLYFAWNELDNRTVKE